MKKFEVYAHQGGSFPPNSFYAFGVAERTGANGIETDVCLTTDGKAIIHHPGTLNPDPADLTWARINEFYPHIPDLDAFFVFLHYHWQLKCLLDIKQNSQALVKIIVCKMKEGDMYERVILTTPKNKIPWAGLYADAGLLAYAKKLDNRVKTHIIDTFPFNLANTARSYKADMVSFGWLNDSFASRILFGLLFKTGLRNMSEEVKRAQREGSRVMMGTPNTQEEIAGLVSICPTVDAILTDNPEMAVAIRDSKN